MNTCLGRDGSTSLPWTPKYISQAVPLEVAQIHDNSNMLPWRDRRPHDKKTLSQTSETISTGMQKHACLGEDDCVVQEVKRRGGKERHTEEPITEESRSTRGAVTWGPMLQSSIGGWALIPHCFRNANHTGPTPPLPAYACPPACLYLPVCLVCLASPPNCSSDSSLVIGEDTCLFEYTPW
ncbi:hypothetical protein LX36DRAFT_10582 [Colletotrichum falcatum]|nr:hypothetical protein LX36DRAFT_10582 [Colletotrichum falcatum]